MGSDRARRSYDEGRQYRRVVPQQGRVFVEADYNEAQEISTEEVRKEALDFVGPAGTPDDGYAVGFSGVAPPDFTVGKGTMYVGGMRVELPAAVTYGAQKEWLDGPVPLLSDVPIPLNELVVLMLAEQEVSAMEDTALFEVALAAQAVNAVVSTALLEVALGVPDTSQRSRLVQRFERFDAGEATTCEDAFAIAEPKLAAARGYHFDRETMRLESSARLFVTHDTEVEDDPCAPETQQGYLGAENQLIRVQISSPPGPNGTLLWAFDNASSLYRVEETTVDAVAGTSTLTLLSRPIDAQHEPRGIQRIEVLRAAVELDAPEDFMAARTGLVTKLVADYDPETRTIVVDQALSSDYLDQKQTPALFVRVWENELDFTADTPVELGETGVFVTLSLVAYAGEDPVFALGDYWLLGVRPGMPKEVLLKRYTEAPQPPDGPRLWACPLAVIQTGDLPTVLSDCREPFDNLVELTKRRCCSIVVGPADVGGGAGLQALLDEHAGSEPYTISLKPGTYELQAPLILGPQHEGLTLRACSKGVTIQAAEGTEAGFLRGLVEMTYADAVTFEGIRWNRAAGGPLVNAVFDNEGALFAIGIRPMFCKGLTVRGCAFNFTLNLPVYPVGVLAGGHCDGLTIEDCQFSIPAPFSDTIGLSAGIVFVPAVEIIADPLVPGKPQSYSGGTVVRSSMSACTIRRNLFTNVSLPVFICADMGVVTIEENEIIGAAEGIVLLSLASVAFDGQSAFARLESALGGVSGGSAAQSFMTLAWILELQLTSGYAAYPRTSSVAAGDVLTAPAYSTTNLLAAFVATVAPLEETPTEMALDLRLSHNVVSLAEQNLLGIFVLDYRTDAHAPAADGAGLVDSNVVSMLGGAAAMVIAFIERCSVTGNVLAARPTDPQFSPYSLIAVRGSHAVVTKVSYARGAVTGNVLEGPAVLPLRPPMLEDVLPWRYFNHTEG